MKSGVSFCRLQVVRQLHRGTVASARDKKVTESSAQHSKRESRFLNKMMGTNQKKKRYNIPSNSHWEGLAAATFQQPGSSKTPAIKLNTKRMAMLNAMMMEYITDIMGSGEVSEKLVGKGIHVSRVRISPDYTFLNVYWMSHGDVTDQKMQDLLDSVAGPLRNELTQLYLMSHVPKILFVKDTSEGNKEVMRILDGLDLGADDEDLPAHTHEEAVQTKSMRHNLLGLPHDIIKEEIIASMKRASAPHRQPGYSQALLTETFPRECIPKDIIEKRAVDFKKFLEERKRLKAKLIRKHEKESMDAVGSQRFQEIEIEEEIEEEEKYDVWEDWEKLQEENTNKS